MINKVDTLFEESLAQIKKIGAKELTFENQEQCDKTYSGLMEKLSTLLAFTSNLLRECNSRSIYNSTDVSFQIIIKI